jgi:hypothetical protein
VWYRVFGSNDVPVNPTVLLEYLQRAGYPTAGHFREDDHGWFHADLVAAGTEEPVELECYLASEEGIRAQLNTWAAWLETREKNLFHDELMQRLIQTRQIFTLFHPPGADDRMEAMCLELCRFLARETDGVYQVDGHGFLSATGDLLVEETGETS